MLAPSLAVDPGALPSPSTLWRFWGHEPVVLSSLVVLAALYGRAVYVSRRDGGPQAIPALTIGCFIAGWLALGVALVSPLDPLGETLFAGHMVQHLVLIMVAAPLLVFGAPPTIWLWVVSRGRRQSVGRWWLRARPVRVVVAAATNPPTVLAAHIVALWLWHFPRFYDAALGNAGVHALEHASFLGTAILFWWVVLHPVGRRTLGFGASILYVGVTLCASGALGALLMFSSRPWYSIHAAGEALWGLSALDDQQLAGLLMWIPASVIYLGAAAALFARWMAADERTTRLTESIDSALALGDAR